MQVTVSRSVQKRISIVKSEYDNRLYRGLELANGMNVLLINDPTAEKAAAALDIRVDPIADSPYVPGFPYVYQGLLTYYLTKEGMHQRFFKAYVEDNDGTIDINKQMEFTTYCFDINPNKLMNALIHFADFFNKSPDFSSMTIETIRNELLDVLREIKNYHKLDDKWKATEYIKWIRYHHEIPQETDCKTSKEIITMMEKMDSIEIINLLYERFYSADKMRLCVLGKESLDELEDLVVRLFSPVKKNTHKFVSPVPRARACNPISANNVYKIHLYAPFEKDSKLHMVFQMKYHEIDYHCAPDYFFAYLFEHDGKKSLLSVLEAKNWGNSIEVELLPETNKSTFVVTVDLTREGFEHVDDIVTLYFKYINMLDRIDEFTLRQSYEEYKKIEELTYRFEEKESSLKYVAHNVQTMQEWPLKYVLRNRHIPIEWKRESVQQILEGFLSPLRMSIYVASYDCGTVTHSIEPCFKYRYKVEEVPMETRAKWIKPYISTKFHIPARNEFMPTTIDIKPNENNEGSFPRKIKDTGLLTLWHKKDDTFNEPKATMIFHFVRLVVDMDPTNANLTAFFVWLINKSLSKYRYPAGLVDLHWELCITDRGIQLKITGFDNKQRLLLEKIMDRMVNFRLNPRTFEDEKINFIGDIEEEVEDFFFCPKKLAKHYLSLLLTNVLDKEEIHKSFRYVTIEKMYNYISWFFNAVYVEGLIHGNVTRTEALDIARIIENKLSHATAMKLKLEDDIKLRHNQHLIFHKEKLQAESCTLVFYQIERQSIKWDVLLDFLQTIINKFCCDLLKVEKGKEIWDFTECASVYRSNEIQGLTILAQSLNNVYIDDACIYYDVQDKIDELIHSTVEYIANMSRETFEIIKTFIIKTRYADKPKTLNDLSNAFWNEIFNQQYYFDRTDVEINKLHEITLHDLYLFSKKFINKKTPILSIHVTPLNVCMYNSTFKSQRYVELFDDISLFKNSLVSS